MSNVHNELLGNGNYFHWEFNMRMTLARKSLLSHIAEVKPEEPDPVWKVMDMKAFAIIAQGVQIEHQSKIRMAESASEAWLILKEYFNRKTMHNRIALTRRLHEFKMEQGDSMCNHIDKFQEIVISLAQIGEVMDENAQMVILLGSLPREYDMVIMLLENVPNIRIGEVKERLIKEYEKQSKYDVEQAAFKAQGRKDFKKNKFDPRKKKNYKNVPKGACFKCGKQGHFKKNCPSWKVQEELSFAVGSKNEGWLMDSGATSHMSPNKEDFYSYEKLCNVNVVIANGASVKAKGIGNVRITSRDEKIIILNEVLHVPELDRRLISITKMAERGAKVLFSTNDCKIYVNGNLATTIPRIGTVHCLETKPTSDMAYKVEMKPDNDMKLWHARLGHASESRVSQININGMKIKGSIDEDLCSGCNQGKMTIESFPKAQKQKKTSQVLQLIHTDLMGPIKPQTDAKSKFILTFIDDYSRFITVYFLKSKSEVTTKFMEYNALMCNQLNSKIKCIRSDNGTEYVNKKFTNYCKSQGIIHQRTVPYSPQQNGLAERTNRTIMEMARSSMMYKRMDKKWWAEAVNTAVYILNRLPSSNNGDITPYEVIYRKEPEMRHFKVFGSHGYAYENDPSRSKLDPKSYECIFIGYENDCKGYRVYDIKNKKVKISRTIKVDEREIDSIYEEDSSKASQLKWCCIQVDDQDEFPINNNEEQTPTPMDVDEVGTPCIDLSPCPCQDQVMEGDAEQENQIEEYCNRDYTVEEIEELDEPSTLVFSGNTRGNRVKRPERRFIQSDPHRYIEDIPRNLTENSITVYQNDVSETPTNKRPRTDDDGVEYVFAAEIPSSYKEAMQSELKARWEEAINNELKSHEQNGTWKIIPRTKYMKPIGCKWVFAHKKNKEGEITRFKARLVAQGFNQQYGLNYFETYSPVANFNSIRVFLAKCCHMGYYIKQYDVETAFLYGKLEEEIYMKIPSGIDINEDYVCKLEKSLYGLKQASHIWNKTIHEKLIKIGFKSSSADPCIYIKKITKDDYIYLCLYVDDMLIASKKEEEIYNVKNQMKESFKIKELGNVELLLGVTINYEMDKKQLHLKQSSYIKEIIKRFGQENSKTINNPMRKDIKITRKDCAITDEEKNIMKGKPYRSLIGCLLYIALCTRPDISYSVMYLSKFLENPGEAHWNQAIKVLRYLKGTQDQGILYHGNNILLNVEAYSDADWGTNQDDRKSVSGSIVTINDGPVIYKSKTQSSVALSSVEAEYMAVTSTTQDVIWLRKLLFDMGHIFNEPTTIYEDNQGTIALGNNDGYSARTKHIDIRHHFIREKIKNLEVKMIYIDTKKQKADILTKQLPTATFEELRKMIMV